ncbi:IS3 family transposase [Kocuria sp. MNB10]
MIRFIDMHRDQFGVEAICRTLSATGCGFITSRGYRAAKQRPASARALRDKILTEELKRIHAENYSVYGVRKMHHAMARAGWEIGRDQVARLMRAAALQGVRRGRKPVTTRPAGEPDHRPDLVKRHFTAERPHQLWVADITYVRSLGGFCYTAFVTDVFTRKIVGWAVSASLHTVGLPLLALEHALLNTGASRGRQGLVHHSDRGSQGGFNWLSQHPDREGVWWDEIQRNQRCRRVRVDSGKRIGRSDRSCGRRGIRSTAGMSSQRSGIR